jgi:glycosyltransferase involved in cell wall biosynthesis
MIEGGQKILGTFNKAGSAGEPLISIITVVYNNEKLIELTIKSIIEQTYKSIEYIIIDGDSSDHTLQMIRQYNDQISYWLSEPDKGLYDAMNKGLARATGDYVCFLNSGDRLYRNDTIEKAFKDNSLLPDIVYGETMIVGSDRAEIGLRRLKAPEKLTWRSFRNGMVVCHQSVYVRRALAMPYNLKYKISADFEWVLKALKKSNTIRNSGLVLTCFLDGGINKKNIRRGLSERFVIMTEHYGLMPTLLKHFIIGIKFFWYYFRNKRF